MKIITRKYGLELERRHGARRIGFVEHNGRRYVMIERIDTKPQRNFFEESVELTQGRALKKRNWKKV